MADNTAIKEQIKIIANKNPEKHYPIAALKELNFTRKTCSKCLTNFWTLDSNREVCGNASCSSGFTFIGNSPAKKQLSYTDVWKEFSKIHKILGYTPINRYPVVSRWNPTTDFTIASIAAFQPYVVSGEVSPPANPLVIPQFCLRFTDIDSVGLSGHFTGFVMLGQHAFTQPKKYDINKYLIHHLAWLNKGLGINNKHLTIHEDAWLGGGNLGTSVEFFSHGLEISNQVYMQYEMSNSNIRELGLKVLDMGQGQERAAWFTQGSLTSYDATFPFVLSRLYKMTDTYIDKNLLKRFIPFSSYLNIGEFSNIEESWNMIAKKLDVNQQELKDLMSGLAALYSVAEHSRSLLVAINDGSLPSNVGSGYNLRLLARRAFAFIDKYNWEISLPDICRLHSKELSSQYPELKDNLNEIDEILGVERAKYYEAKRRSRVILSRIIGSAITNEKLIELYDSQGISPEMVGEEAAKTNKKVIIPSDFYARVSERHEKAIQKHATERIIKLELENIPETKQLFYKDYKLAKCKAKVLKIVDNYVVLNQTIAYPTSGGQLHDNGAINSQKFMDVFKQGNIIIHRLREKPKFKQGSQVEVKIDIARRLQLAHHHTSTHILNAAARNILGRHINQASAFKDVDKARLDITHFKSLTEEELRKIEDEANRIIKAKITIEKCFMPRNEAEKKFGFNIYQGPAVPGKLLRIVNIKNTDVECCSGTHLDNTKEAIKIKILKASKISDSITRLEFVAGKRALEEEHKESKLIENLAKLLNVRKTQVPSRAQELFDFWKAKVKKGKDIEVVFKAKEEHKLSDKDLLSKTSEILKTQPEHLAKTIIRFLNELNLK